jgi:2'-5' RNA ligase
MTATRRLYFALWPNPRLQTALAEVTRNVVAVSVGRPTPAENFHITLAFLGSVPEAAVERVEEVAVRVAGGVAQQSVAVRLDALEYWRKAQVLVATSPAESDSVLADTLKERLKEGGFSPDMKDFRAHVTLARKVTHPPAPISLQPTLWSFSDFALVESRTIASGPTYTVLKSFPLSRCGATETGS